MEGEAAVAAMGVAAKNSSARVFWDRSRTMGSYPEYYPGSHKSIADALRRINLSHIEGEHGKVIELLSHHDFPYAVMHGGSGSGKSTLAAAIADGLVQIGERIVWTAPQNRLLNNDVGRFTRGHKLIIRLFPINAELDAIMNTREKFKIQGRIPKPELSLAHSLNNSQLAKDKERNPLGHQNSLANQFKNSKQPTVKELLLRLETAKMKAPEWPSRVQTSK